MESEDQAKHPPYMFIWGVLFAFTVGEVFFAFMDIPKIFIVVGLLIMAVWKAILVALYYMHLKFEPKRLWALAAVPLPLIAILFLFVLNENF